jgi:ribosomal-protein-alanine N-acetyltransferase
MLAADAPSVRKLLQSIPEASHWSEDLIRRSLHSHGGIAIVCERDQSIMACAFGASVAGEAEILNLGVHPQVRRKGLASSLVRHLLAEWRKQDVRRIFIEVRESNAGAIHLYRKMGFKPTGRRINYYTLPDEDALILERARLEE